MSEITFNCPRCAGSLTVDSRGAGKTVCCPLCKEPILIPGESSSPPQQVPGQQPTVDRLGEKIIIYSSLATHTFYEGHTILGRYRVVCELGQGGMGDVYRCLDETGCIDVALKALPAELSRNTTAMKEVRDNFRLIEKLHHPNIAAVKTLECDTETGDFYLIMEYVEGINLYFYRKKQGGRLTKDQALPILRQIAAALDYAHSEKILHRDIKPSNLIIRPDGTVKLLDFGLATQIQASVHHAQEESYDSSGTGAYMAPEQWRGQYQGPATDQYALACTAYELLAGHVPFSSSNLIVLREAVLNKAPPSIDGLDSQTWGALKRGLSKDWGKRFTSCTEFVQALSGEIGGPIPTQENVNPARGIAFNSQGKRKLLWLFAVGLMVIIGLFAGAIFYKYYQDQVTAKIAAEKQQYLDKIAGEVRALLEANNISTAKEKVTKAEALELGGPTLHELKNLLARATNKQEAIKHFAEASQAREKAQKVRRDEYGMFLDRMEVSWRVAELARVSGAYEEAQINYNKVAEQSREILAMEAKRNQTLATAKTTAGEQVRDTAKEMSQDKPLYPDLKSRWENSLGMKFVPVPGTEVLFCIWETRVRDYEQFVKATAREWPKPDFVQGLEHPAVKVSWDDAKQFCVWLTKKDRATGLLGPSQSYRLPCDWEWSMAVGLNEPQTGTPKDKDAKSPNVYPWGHSWPPPRRAGNFADVTAKQAFSDRTVIEGYADGYADSAPVGSFKPNPFGLYDLSGNVWEWCEDFYDGQSGFRVLRGGAWSDGEPGTLLSSYRGSNPPEIRYGNCGFRVVVAQRANESINQPQPVRQKKQATETASEIRPVTLVRDKPWENSLGMKLLPVPGTEVLFCIWETRVRDYEQFVKATGQEWSRPSFPYSPDHPAGTVNWDETQKFCAWLTKKERDSGLIGPNQVYRLPRDWEWSVAAGLKESKVGTPEEKKEKITDVYPWGQGHGVWPPPRGSGNYDQSLSVDDFKDTSPVGSFGCNAHGLFDMGGNVWEWCEDTYSLRGVSRVARGGSCYSKEPRDLLSSRRGYNRPEARFSSTGFRVVLGRTEVLSEMALGTTETTRPVIAVPSRPRREAPVMPPKIPLPQPKPPEMAAEQTPIEPSVIARSRNGLEVDLGVNRQISGVVIPWGVAYPLDYQIQTSTDGSSWTTVLRVTNSKGGRAIHNIKITEGRYLRTRITRRSRSAPNDVERIIEAFGFAVYVDGNKLPSP